MSRSMRIIVLVAVCSMLVLAATPVATVTSAAPFELSGVRVQVAGIRAWPVAPGDQLSTTTSSAVLQFADKTVVTLDRNSSAKVEQNGRDTILRLVSGAMTYKVASGSRMQVFAGQQRLREAAAWVSVDRGRVQVSGKHPPVDKPGPPPDPPGRSKWHKDAK